MVNHGVYKLDRTSAFPRSQKRTYGKLAAGALLVAAFVGLLFPWISGDLVQSGDAAAYMQPVPSEMAPFVYTPDVYPNQAQNAQPEEHIQAF
jgi:hypothetical protein